MNTKMTRAAAAVGGLAITAAFAVSCAETKDAAKDMASSAASVGSSAASAAGSAVSSGASAAGSAASSAGSAASSVASSGASVAGSAASSGASVASSVASSGASVAGSAASSGASVAGSAASSGVSVASSVVSSVLKGAPDAAPGKAVAAEAVEKTSSKWWWIPVGIALAALLAGLMRMLTRRKPEPVKVAVDRAPEVKTTRVVKDPAPKGRVTDERDKLND